MRQCFIRATRERDKSQSDLGDQAADIPHKMGAKQANTNPLKPRLRMFLYPFLFRGKGFQYLWLSPVSYINKTATLANTGQYGFTQILRRASCTENGKGKHTCHSSWSNCGLHTVVRRVNLTLLQLTETKDKIAET